MNFFWQKSMLSFGCCRSYHCRIRTSNITSHRKNNWKKRRRREENRFHMGIVGRLLNYLNFFDRNLSFFGKGQRGGIVSHSTFPCLMVKVLWSNVAAVLAVVVVISCSVKVFIQVSVVSKGEGEECWKREIHAKTVEAIVFFSELCRRTCRIHIVCRHTSKKPRGEIKPGCRKMPRCCREPRTPAVREQKSSRGRKYVFEFFVL